MVRIRFLLDNLTVAVSLFGVLPVYLYLDLPTQIVFPLALLIGARCDRRGEYFLTARSATILSLLVFAVYAFQINRDDLVEPVLNVAVLLLAVRLLTEKEGRHFLQIFLLSGFALAGSSLVTLSLAFLPLMVLLVTGVIFGLILLCFYSDDPQLTLDRAGFYKLLRIGLALPAGAFLLALLFFFILPRTQHPLWDFLNPGGKLMVGFSEEVKPGTFSSTVSDESVAFRVEAQEMDPNDLYWRVTVLDLLEGTIWKRAYKSPYGRPEVTGGRPVEVTIFPEANHGKFLATLDTPVAIEGVRSRHWTDGTFLLRRSAKKPQSYRIKANLNGSLRADPDIAGEPYLQLPADVSPRTRQAARSLVASTAGREQKIEELKEFFRERQLVYATDDLPLVADPIDNFIFESRRGYCEYFASAFAIMLRETGVPARLVGGYLGGTYNPLGGYYIVGEKNAHVWVEALSEDGEWLRIDPNLYAINAETSLLARSLQQRPGWQQMADAIDYYWTQVVITFDFARQLQFLKSAREKIGDWRRNDTSWNDYVSISLLPLAVIALLAVRRYKIRPVEERLLHNFTRMIRRQHGEEELPAGLGIFTMARRLNDRHASEFARIYSAAIYQDRRLQKNEIDRLRKLLREMKKTGDA